MRRFGFPFCPGQLWSSDMMRFPDLMATARILFGGRRLTFGFLVLLFVGVVLFPIPSLCGSCVVP